MTRKEWTIRVIMSKTDSLNPEMPGVWLEQFRYMGLVRILSEDDNRTVLEFRYPGNPNTVDTHVWASQNSERMHSFGINAAPAPKWGNN